MDVSARVLLIAVAFALCGVGHAQVATAGTATAGQAEAGSSGVRTVLKVTTREVVVDLVATDAHDQPVTDLQARELNVFEIAANSKRSAQRLTSVRFLPALSQSARPAGTSSLHVTLGSGCAARTTPHYEITYHVSQDDIRSGMHSLVITSGRPGVRLAFGAHYYVAGTEEVPTPPKQDSQIDEARLLQAACFHSMVPLSLPVVVHPLETGSPEGVRYQVTLPANALELASVNVNSRKVNLEYAACSFDQNGRPVHFMRSSASRTLSMNEYVQASLHGLPSFLEVPATEHAASIRFVLRDAETGNMGATLVSAPDALKEGQLTPDEAKAEQQWKRRLASGRTDTDENFPPPGPIGSFGSLEPRQGAMCGDVYELPSGTTQLPNFWSLDSIGSLYTYSLDVPHQQFWGTGGLPGVTRATEWFGVDYHGAFYVRAAGVYEFELVADDGAKLYIDDHLVINADHVHNVERDRGSTSLAEGWHTLRVPYFQGPPTSVALQLFVQKPGESLQLFDLRNFVSK